MNASTRVRAAQLPRPARDRRAEDGDRARVLELLDVLRRPYDEQPEHERFAARRPEWARDRPAARRCRAARDRVILGHEAIAFAVVALAALSRG